MIDGYSYEIADVDQLRAEQRRWLDAIRNTNADFVADSSRSMGHLDPTFRNPEFEWAARRLVDEVHRSSAELSGWLDAVMQHQHDELFSHVPGRELSDGLEGGEGATPPTPPCAIVELQLMLLLAEALSSPPEASP